MKIAELNKKIQDKPENHTITYPRKVIRFHWSSYQNNLTFYALEYLEKSKGNIESTGVKFLVENLHEYIDSKFKDGKFKITPKSGRQKYDRIELT